MHLLLRSKRVGLDSHFATGAVISRVGEGWSLYGSIQLQILNPIAPVVSEKIKTNHLCDTLTKIFYLKHVYGVKEQNPLCLLAHNKDPFRELRAIKALEWSFELIFVAVRPGHGVSYRSSGYIALSTGKQRCCSRRSVLHSIGSASCCLVHLHLCPQTAPVVTQSRRPVEVDCSHIMCHKHGNQYGRRVHCTGLSVVVYNSESE